MSDTFTWNIKSLDRYVADGTVYCVNWDLIGLRVTTEGASYLSLLSASTGLNGKDPNNFIPYESLTEDVVIDWLESTLGTNAIEEYKINLKKELDEKENPKTEQGVPWVKVPEPEVVDRPPYPDDIDGVKHVWNETTQSWILDPNNVNPTS